MTACSCRRPATSQRTGNSCRLQPAGWQDAVLAHRGLCGQGDAERRAQRTELLDRVLPAPRNRSRWRAAIGLGPRFADSGETARVPGYVVWNAMLSYKLGHNVTLQLNGLNLFKPLLLHGTPTTRARRKITSFTGGGPQRHSRPSASISDDHAGADQCRTDGRGSADNPVGPHRCRLGRRTADCGLPLSRGEGQSAGARSPTPAAVAASAIVIRALERNARFISATLPHRVFPPLFNRYEPGMGFGDHVDNAVRQIPGTPHRLRTDVPPQRSF